MEERQINIAEALSALRQRTSTTKIRYSIKGFSNLAEYVEQVYAFVCEGDQPYEPTKELQDNIRSISNWLQGNGKPAVILCGTPGTGKTTLVKAIELIVRQNNNGVFLRIVSALDMSRIAKDDSGEFERLQKSELLAVDDVGVEPVEVKNYGNAISPLIELLYYRYDHRMTTILTTNLSVEMLTKVYGERVGDRIRGWCNIIYFKHKSYRK